MEALFEGCYLSFMKTSVKPKKGAVVSARLPSIHPGRILRKEILEENGITQTQLAAATGLPVSRINDLVKERRGITVDSAIRRGKALGISTELWLICNVPTTSKRRKRPEAANAGRSSRCI